MTGPEHYKEAERLLAAADKISRHLGGLPSPVTTTQQKQEIDAGEQAILTVAARAQAHATLALADFAGGIVDSIREGVGP